MCLILNGNRNLYEVRVFTLSSYITALILAFSNRDGYLKNTCPHTRLDILI